MIFICLAVEGLYLTYVGWRPDAGVKPR